MIRLAALVKRCDMVLLGTRAGAEPLFSGVGADMSALYACAGGGQTS